MGVTNVVTLSNQTLLPQIIISFPRGSAGTRKTGFKKWM